MNCRFPNNSPAARNEKGSVLILVLAALVMLSLMAFSVGYTVRQKLQVISRLEEREKLRLAADAAAQQISVLLQERQSQLQSPHGLNQAWAYGEETWKRIDFTSQIFYSAVVDPVFYGQGTRFGLVDEARKINLNTAEPHVLQNLFEAAGGVEKENARRIVAAIRDWIDEDEDLHDGGAESKIYASFKPPYKSQNKPFHELNELLWVQGMTAEIWQKVTPYLTLDAPRVNLNTAPAIVLEAMGLDSDMVSQVLEYRNGKDGLPGTADDRIFNTPNSVGDTLSAVIYLNANDQENLNAAISPYFSVQSDVFQAQIEVRTENRDQFLRAHFVVDTHGKVLRWREEFLSL